MLKKKLNIVIPFNYDLCQVLLGFFVKKLKKESSDEKSLQVCQSFLFKDTNNLLFFSLNFLSSEDFNSFLNSSGANLVPKIRIINNNLDFLSLFQEDLFSKDNNILFSSDWFLEKNKSNFFEDLKNKLTEELDLNINITVIFEDFFDLIRYRFFSAFRSFYNGFKYSNINEFAINYEMPRIENALSSLTNMVSIFGRENFNFIYQKRDLFRDNFPKQSWEKILTCLNVEEADFTEDFLSIDIKQTSLTINPLFNDYYNEIFNKSKHDPNFRQIILGEIQKVNKLTEFYRIPLTENIHFNSKNSEKIISLNSSLEELTNLKTLPKQTFIKSKKTNQLITFKYFSN